MSEDWYPERYRPDRGWPLAQYSTMGYAKPYLRLNDIAAPRLRPKRATFWRACRDQALASWEVAGFTFAVREQPSTAYQCDGVTLNLVELDPVSTKLGGWTDHETDPCSTDPLCNCCWVHVDQGELDSAFASGFKKMLRYVICHEVGHALGFGHGGTGVMPGDYRHQVPPNAEELAAVRSFWL